jgi:hypothetical protein
MGIVYIASGEEDFRIGVRDAADVVEVFDARVGDKHLAADRIGPPVADQQHGGCHGNPQQRRTEDAWLHGFPIGLGLQNA